MPYDVRGSLDAGDGGLSRPCRLPLTPLLTWPCAAPVNPLQIFSKVLPPLGISIALSFSRHASAGCLPFFHKCTPRPPHPPPTALQAAYGAPTCRSPWRCFRAGHLPAGATPRRHHKRVVPGGGARHSEARGRGAHAADGAAGRRRRLAALRHLQRARERGGGARGGACGGIRALAPWDCPWAAWRVSRRRTVRQFEPTMAHAGSAPAHAVTRPANCPTPARMCPPACCSCGRASPST
jgi:hypothetical protein